MNQNQQVASIAVTITAACVAVLVATNGGNAKPDAPAVPTHGIARVCQGGACVTCESLAMPDSKQSRVLMDTCTPVAIAQPIGKLGGGKIAQPAQIDAAKARVDALAALTAPDDVSFLTGDDAKAAAGCACANVDPAAGDCIETGLTDPQGNALPDAPARHGMTLAPGTWSGDGCVPKHCVAFAEANTALGVIDETWPKECGP